MQLVILTVRNLILPKRHIADSQIKEAVRQVGFFVATDLNFCFLV